MKPILNPNRSSKIVQAFVVLLATIVSIAFVPTRADESAALPAADTGAANQLGGTAESVPEAASEKRKKASNPKRTARIMKQIKAVQRKLAKAKGKRVKALARRLARLRGQLSRA